MSFLFCGLRLDREREGRGEGREREKEKTCQKRLRVLYNTAATTQTDVLDQKQSSNDKAAMTLSCA